MTKEEYKALSRQEKFDLHLKDLMQQIDNYNSLYKKRNDWLFRMLKTSVENAHKQNLIIPIEVQNFLLLS